MNVAFADLSPWLLLLAPLVMTIAYTVFGLSGFGSTVIAVPILAHFLPVPYLVPLMAVLDMVCAAFIGRANRQDVAVGELKRLIPFMFVGFVIGATVLVGVPERYLRLALGIFAVGVGVHGIFNPTLHRQISAWWVVPTGIVGGAIATVFGAGGPIYATYFGGRLRDKGALRSTISTLISISAFSRAIVYAVTGLLLHMSMLVGGLLLAPFAWLGLKIGQRIHVGLTQQQMRRTVGALLVLTGMSLLARVLLQ
ncbi:MAG TPA: sulfite exporter TauE/SafE family protein [Usitatibacter sp.]|nr:sulfite exporter TauE/SafE family protein [Usitatibacter sp.]